VILIFVAFLTTQYSLPTRFIFTMVIGSVLSIRP